LFNPYIRFLMLKSFSFILLLYVNLSVLAQPVSTWSNSRGNALLQGASSVEFPEKPTLKWIYDAEGIFKSAPIIYDNKIFVGSTNGDMLCISTQGKLLWKFSTGNAIEAPGLIIGNTLYFGNLTGSFYALDAKTGKKKWEYKAENQIMGAPVYFENNQLKIIAFGSYDFYLHGVNAQTGKVIWKYETENFLNSAPALYNGMAVFGGCDGHLHLVNLINGKAEKKIQVASYVASSPAISKNFAFIGDYDGAVSAIDLSKGSIAWQFKNSDNEQPFIASPSFIDNKIIIGSRDKFIYCIDSKSGKQLWKTNTGNRVDASTVVNKNRVLTVNMRGDLILLDLKTGKKRWTYEIGTSVINSPAVVEGMIVVAASDGNLYCFGN
jgi:outer membrane protein assembly factor BamB